VRSVEASHFRGLTTKISLSLEHPRTEQPVSLLLCGDNGSGKSSLVDAIEFGLQGLIGVTEANSPLRPIFPSLAGDDDAEVSVVLNDGSVCRRSIVQHGGAHRVTHNRAHPKFSVSPLVLRRRDILRFQDAPESQRVLVFWNYLSAADKRSWEESPNNVLRRLQSERLAARAAP